MDVEPVTLEREYVRLEPLSVEHFDGLLSASVDGDLFQWFNQDLSDRETLREWVENAISHGRTGTALPFVTVHAKTDEVIGSTRFLNLARDHRRVEVGATWLAATHQRTAANTEAKYLMLRHAFEEWGCHRVEFKTDTRNRRSRAALERIGAREEGTLRHHMRTQNGRRDTVYFSILDEEWPAVEQSLTERLDRDE